MRLTAILLLLLPALARAHDFGAMLVTLAARNGIVQGTIRVDPSHLPADTARATLQAALASGSHLGSYRPVLTPVGGPDDGTIRWCFTAPALARWRCDAPVGRYLLRVERDEVQSAQWLDPGQTSDAFCPESISTARVIADHLRLGFTHIVPGGLDHILFVLGLFLLSARIKPVLWQATAFTAAHSITLALAACGVLSPPSSIVEPLIAVSIAYVGIENLFTRQSVARRSAVVFAFGLLHGLGFAGVLRETGLPEGHLVPALVSFNVGVELGQAAVILGAFLLVGIWFGRRSWYHARIAAPASLAIAAVALVWTVQRIAV